MAISSLIYKIIGSKNLPIPFETPLLVLYDFANDTNRKKIYRWMHNGVIRTIKDGNRFYIPKAEIERIEAHLDASNDVKVGS